MWSWSYFSSFLVAYNENTAELCLWLTHLKAPSKWGTKRIKMPVVCFPDILKFLFCSLQFRFCRILNWNHGLVLAFWPASSGLLKTVQIFSVKFIKLCLKVSQIVSDKCCMSFPFLSSKADTGQKHRSPCQSMWWYQSDIPVQIDLNKSYKLIGK